MCVIYGIHIGKYLHYIIGTINCILHYASASTTSPQNAVVHHRGLNRTYYSLSSLLPIIFTYYMVSADTTNEKIDDDDDPHNNLHCQLWPKGQG